MHVLTVTVLIIARNATENLINCTAILQTISEALLLFIYTFMDPLVMMITCVGMASIDMQQKQNCVPLKSLSISQIRPNLNKRCRFLQLL